MKKEGIKKIDLLIFVIRPIVRFALRHGLRFQEASQILKLCFLQEAERELVLANKKVNNSRLSVITGLQRKDIERTQKLELDDCKTSLISKVIGYWSLSKEFTEKNGKPKKLKCVGNENEFVKLVRAVSKDLHPGTLMFELERQKLIEREQDSVCLVTKVFDIGKEPLETFKLLSENLDDLIKAVEQNVFNEKIQSNKIPANLHAITEFTKINIDKIETLRHWLLLEGSVFHAKIREHLAQYDLDINPDQDCRQNEGVRLSLGTFSIIDREV